MSDQPHPHAGPAPTTKDDIFLSPRVVDRQAFNEFAGQLRALIDQAAAQADALRSAAGEAQRTRDGLRDAINANQMKLDMATRTLATIDQKADQTRRMIESASDVAHRVDELRTTADQIISERVGILCQRLNEAEEAAVTQVDTLHARLVEAVQGAAGQDACLREAIDAASGPQIERLAELVARADAVAGSENGLASMIERADAAGRLAIRATSELAGVREQADQARQILAEALNAAVPIIDDAGTVQGHLEHTVAEAIRLTQTAQQAAARDADARRTALEQQLSRVQPTIEQARAELDAIVHAAAAARDAAAQATAAAELASERLASLLDEVRPWQRVLLGGNEDAPVGAAINGVVVELKRELRGVAGALRALAERTEFAIEPDMPAPAITITGAAASTAA
jgi:chromosome segregation ATPase